MKVIFKNEQLICNDQIDLQPEWRAQFGHLEKKKDYVKRAADYNAKKKRLLKLRQKALDRNPDEFHFHMVKSRVGVGSMPVFYSMIIQPFIISCLKFVGKMLRSKLEMSKVASSVMLCDRSTVCSKLITRIT